MRESLESLVEQIRRGGILYREAVGEFKKAYLAAVLRANNGNLSKAAAALALHRNTLARICAELALDPKEFRPSRRSPRSAPGRLIVKRTAQ
ncbi:MAG TPA: helix-turn-helix domain-containing protein [Terriglobales bacterium]|nr:helix-turn-helix domain-containing protein [Terriglobales bacterium]